MMIALLFANGTEEIEALFPVDYLRRCGIEIDVIAVNDGTSNEVSGRSGIKVACDYNANDVDFDKYQAIVFPGGIPGVDNVIANNAVKQAITAFLDQNKLVAAICAAPAVLAKNGLINEKKATCYPDLANEIDENGAYYVDEDVVSDGMLITSKGVGTTPWFAKAIAESFISKEKAEEVLRGMVFQL